VTRADRCPAGHPLAPGGRRRHCPGCRRDNVIELVAAAGASLPRPVIAAAVDAVAPAGQALRHLAAALAADAGALSRGAPPVAGRLAAELIARGSTTLAILACTVCGRTGKPLTRTPGGGIASRALPARAPLSARTAGRSSRPPDVTPLASASANGAAATTGDTAGAGHAATPRRSPWRPATATRTSA
jgi:hypothetical protein